MMTPDMPLDSKKCIVFFDFDNTITTHDIFDDMLLRFSQNDSWIELEKQWGRGKIGSQECLEGQIRGMSVTKKELDKYLANIKLDPYFKRLIRLFQAKDIETIVLSDNFDYILNRILSHHKIKNLRIYSNKLRISKDRLIPFFPFKDGGCKVCAHCKKKNLLANINGRATIIYIGDGRSDVCPAQYADIVFAKEYLLSYCQENKMECFGYKDLRGAYNYFKKSLA